MVLINALRINALIRIKRRVYDPLLYLEHVEFYDSVVRSRLISGGETSKFISLNPYNTRYLFFTIALP